MSPTVRQKLERLIELVGRRRQWQEVIDALRGMRDWVLTTEHILSGAWATSQEPLSNATVNQRLDQWCATLAQLQATGPLTEEQRRCLAHFLQITHNLRAHLVLCYDHPDFPRTNNDMEGYIRSIKTRYRRISGRKNWNSYLLRYGRSVAYYDCLQREGLPSLRHDSSESVTTNGKRLVCTAVPSNGPNSRCGAFATNASPTCAPCSSVGPTPLLGRLHCTHGFFCKA